jgi:hypothetical protein
MDLPGLLFTPIKPFITHPERIAAVATALFVIFGVLRWAKGRWLWPLLWAAVLWTVFAIWEWLILVQTPEANIRADLLLIYPILLIVTLWGLWAGFRRSSRGDPT